GAACPSYASVYTATFGTTASASIDLSGNTLTIDLTSLANNPKSDANTVSGIQVFFNNTTVTGEGPLTQTGRLITIDNTNSATPGLMHDVGGTSAVESATHWAVSTSGADGVQLSTVGSAHVINLIVGQPNASDIFSNGNKSLLGAPPDRDPYILGTG